ncbi:MAG: dephospho-CoA kinase [Chloroflexales bacterium]|nr:dephospho-CoA kinase [Chloroflexales bacterium]
MAKSHPTLYLIGLTGNIACGKSTVLAMLSALSARTLDADRVTHRLQQPGTSVYQQIVAAFGSQVATAPNSPLDRRKLGEIVFSDPAALARLERIVHPAVHTELRAWLSEVARSSGHGTREQPRSSPVAVIDAIKLLESGWKDEANAIWVVTCTPQQQLDRLMATRGMPRAEAERRIAAQSPQAEKVAQANVVIDNSGSQAATRAQVEAAWGKIAH